MFRNNLLSFGISLMALGCASGLHLVSNSLGDSEANMSNYPNIEIREEKGGSFVYWDDNLIFELRENRFMHFRATPRDENWVGSVRFPADLGWAYDDEKAKGLQVLSTAHENHPEKGEFVLAVRGRKPSFESDIRFSIRGKWLPEARKFQYTLSTRFECPLEAWYENARGKGVGGRQIHALDYRVDYIAVVERPNYRDPVKYEWFVRCDDGKNWTKWPKIHIPFPTRPGNYVTVGYPGTTSPVGGYYGFLDTKHGGWMTRIIKASSPITYGICWAAFDVHVVMEQGIPPRGSTEKLMLEYETIFEPVDVQGVREIIGKARELDWRSAKEYQLPLFSRDNRFDRLISEVPSEETALRLIWWASSYDCFRDDTVGYDDHYSASIKRTDPSPTPIAWNTYTWGGGWEGKSTRNRRFRFSAMVKTRDCTGPVRLAVASSSELGDVFYRRNHNPDGTPSTKGLKWQFSNPVTGTSDWAPVSMEFVAQDRVHSLILEQHGTGQSWFDNVKIEELDNAGKTKNSPVKTP